MPASLPRDRRPTYVCHECGARDMDRAEYREHLRMAHDIRIYSLERAGAVLALAVLPR
jgi:hypothetical protein